MIWYPKDGEINDGGWSLTLVDEHAARFWNAALVSRPDAQIFVKW